MAAKERQLALSRGKRSRAACEMEQQLKVSAAKSDDLSLLPTSTTCPWMSRPVLGHASTLTLLPKYTKNIPQKGYLGLHSEILAGLGYRLRPAKTNKHPKSHLQ